MMLLCLPKDGGTKHRQELTGQDISLSPVYLSYITFCSVPLDHSPTVLSQPVALLGFGGVFFALLIGYMFYESYHIGEVPSVIPFFCGHHLPMKGCESALPQMRRI